MLDFAEKKGLEVKSVTVKSNPKVDKAVRNYINNIESAHIATKKSKLHFGYDAFTPYYT